MINSYEIYIAECDKCGRSFSEIVEEEITGIGELEYMLEQEGWVIKGTSCLCDKCK